jgi:hypothetical protein
MWLTDNISRLLLSRNGILSPSIASYNLRESPASFNFIEFLVAATTLGADHIILDTTQGVKKFKGEELEERIHSIILPAIKLTGCSYEFAASRGIAPGHHMSAVLKTYAEKGFIKKLISPSKGREKFTVTLRNYHRHSERNTNDEWREFAHEIGAHVIEDYYDVPISLEERFALYAGAEMNYFGQNGPMVLCLFSDYPYTAYLPAKGVWKEYHQRHGWYKTQLPWANKNQKVIWSELSSVTTSAKV